MLKGMKMMLYAITDIQCIVKTELNSGVLERIGIVIVVWVTEGVGLVRLQVN